LTAEESGNGSRRRVTESSAMARVEAASLKRIGLALCAVDVRDERVEANAHSSATMKRNSLDLLLLRRKG
jgi:hypothetical protein